MKGIRKYDSNTFVVLVCVFLVQMLQAQNNEVFQQNTANTYNAPQVIFSGLLLKNQEKNQVWYIPNVFQLFPVNTVEDFVFNAQVKFTQNYKDRRFYTVTPNVRYGFGSKRFQAQLKTQYFYNPKKNGLLELSGGRSIEQLYDESTLGALNNTLYTFALSKNFLKIYERSYVELNHTFSPVNDFLLTTSVSWNERNPLSNLSKYEKDEDFISNNPDNVELTSTSFVKNIAILFEAQIRWQIGFYWERQRGELVFKGKHPALTIAYVNATDKILDGDVSYEKLSFGIQNDYEIGSCFGKLFFEVGDFLKKDNLTFVDFNHFKGKETVYGNYDDNQFQLLEYYRNSTADFYIQGHYKHYFKPFYKSNEELMFQPIVGVNYLFTDESGHYTEMGIGVDKMFGSDWRIDLYSSWREVKYESFGIRVGLNFD